MTIRTKALLVLGVTIAGLLLTLHFFLRTILTESFLTTEERTVVRNLNRVVNALVNELDNLNATSADWAVWDDTYRFLQDENTAYRQTNLVASTFSTINIQAFALFNVSGRLLYGEEYDPETRRPGELTLELRDFLATHPEILHPDEGGLKSGLILLGREPALLSSRPVLQSDFQGPTTGTLIMIRRLNEEALRHLANLTQLALSFQPYSPGHESELRIERVSPETVSGITDLRGIDGEHLLTLRIDTPREIYGQWQKSLSYMLVSVIAAGGVFIFSIWFIIDRMVLLRLSTLAGSIRKIRSSDDLSCRVSVTGHDELSHLEREINGMMHSLEGSEKQIRHQAYHDPLTDLPNRTLFYRNLDAALEQARSKDRKVAVLLLDLDRFKLINDMLGHSIGDLLLKQVASRLQDCVGRPEAVSRLGGDEFTVIMADLDAPVEADTLARKILTAFEDPFSVEERLLYVNTSIGISLYPHDGETVEILIQNADAALFHMKDKGRNHYWFYSAEISTLLSRRALLEGSLRSAFEQKEFLLHYQPQVDTVSGRVIGLEALLRWQKPGGEMVSPEEFVGVLEETGLIVPVDEWVLQSACRQNKDWQDAGHPAVPVSVNVSTLQFQRPALIETVTRILGETGLHPRYLKMEITESLAMFNVEEVIVKLTELQALGVHIQIDDFGTGYSSLSYLKKFPINTLKIDRSFIRDISTDTDDADIVASIIAMAQRLKINVLAEGVETEEQARLLRDLGCGEMQGFFFSRPLPPENIPDFLREYRTPAALALLPPSRSLCGQDQVPLGLLP